MEKSERMENERKEKTASKAAQYKNYKADRGTQEHITKPGRKETKPEYSRRMEEKKRLEGKQMMKSNLWKQRREKDGRLISIWKELRIECGDNRRMEEGREPRKV